MSQELQILYLAFDASSHISIDQLAPGDDLQGHLLAADLMHRQLDLAKGSLSERLDNIVLAEPLRRPYRIGGVIGMRSAMWWALLARYAFPWRMELAAHGNGNRELLIVKSWRHLPDRVRSEALDQNGGKDYDMRNVWNGMYALSRAQPQVGWRFIELEDDRGMSGADADGPINRIYRHPEPQCVQRKVGSFS